MRDLDVKPNPARDQDIERDYRLILWYINYKQRRHFALFSKEEGVGIIQKYSLCFLLLYIPNPITTIKQRTMNFSVIRAGGNFSGNIPPPPKKKAERKIKQQNKHRLKKRNHKTLHLLIQNLGIQIELSSIWNLPLPINC